MVGNITVHTHIHSIYMKTGTKVSWNNICPCIQSTMIFLCYFIALKCWWWLTKLILCLLVHHNLQFEKYWLWPSICLGLAGALGKTLRECRKVTTQGRQEWAWILMILSQSWIPSPLIVDLEVDMWHNPANEMRRDIFSGAPGNGPDLKMGQEEEAFLFLTLSLDLGPNQN